MLLVDVPVWEGTLQGNKDILFPEKLLNWLSAVTLVHCVTIKVTEIRLLSGKLELCGVENPRIIFVPKTYLPQSGVLPVVERCRCKNACRDAPVYEEWREFERLESRAIPAPIVLVNCFQCNVSFVVVCVTSMWSTVLEQHKCTVYCSEQDRTQVLMFLQTLINLRTKGTNDQNLPLYSLYHWAKHDVYKGEHCLFHA